MKPQPPSVRNLRRLAPLLLLAALAGGVVSSLLVPPPARAQAAAGGCAQWDVATFLPNTDDTQIEFLPLGLPRPLDPQFSFPFPRTEGEAALTLPPGWEPISFGAAAGQTGEAVVLARRCAS